MNKRTEVAEEVIIFTLVLLYMHRLMNYSDKSKSHSTLKELLFVYYSTVEVKLPISCSSVLHQKVYGVSGRCLHVIFKEARAPKHLRKTMRKLSELPQ